MLLTARLSVRSPPTMRPIVAVIGTTGVGKSQLAVHLAQSLERDTGEVKGSAPGCYNRGKVLSADSMQLYKGLDVITNKVTDAEMGGVEHWGLDMVEPGRESSWELGKWCTEADKVVASLPENTLPILCGGTHYFIQHFLFPPPELSTTRPSSPSKAGWTPPHPRPPVPDLDPELLQLLDTFWTGNPIWPGEIGGSSLPSTTWSDSQLLCLHRLLVAVDPREAGRWHWRDGRKVKRGLERWWERGGEVHSAKTGPKARFRTLIFWVYEPMETLRPRLDKRVDKMVENGLLREIAELRGIAQDIYGSADAVDHTEGIFQAIGYKEFSKLPIDPALDPTARPSFPSMLDRMKISTHQYAKSQLKWISNQLLPAIREAKATGGEVCVYVIPGGAANEEISQHILSDFLAGKPTQDPTLAGHSQATMLLRPLTGGAPGESGSIASRQAVNVRRECELCSTPSAPFSVMAKDWDIHVRSKTHKRSVITANGGREALIQKQKASGLERAAERARLRNLSHRGPP